MKISTFICAILAAIVFLILTEVVPYPKRKGAAVNYAPDGFLHTIAENINQRVFSVEQNGLYWVTFVDGRKLPFSFDFYKLPGGWEKFYPEHFIQVGDSIYKNANSDTFYLIRGNHRWQYFLPK